MNNAQTQSNDRYAKPLGYARASYLPGTRIGVPDEELVAALSCADELVLDLRFSLVGDSILYIAVAQACHEAYFLLKGRWPKWIVVGHNTGLLTRSPLLHGAALLNTPNDLAAYSENSGRRLFVISDSKDLRLKPPTYVHRKSDCQYPIYKETQSDGTEIEHRALPARYYLAFERQVGRVLLSAPSDAHPGFLFPDDRILQSTFTQSVLCPERSNVSLCALIATTSLPEKKQFGVPRFLQVATALQHRWREFRLHIVLVLSPSMVELDEGPSADSIFAAGRDSSVTICSNSRLEELGFLFARTTLVIGNDTGLTHLAGLSQKPPPHSPPPVIQLYSRHDYTRWTSGRPNVYPLFTAFSRYLRDNNLATITDHVNDEDWGPGARATAINAKDVLALADSLLTQRFSGAGKSDSGTQVS